MQIEQLPSDAGILICGHGSRAEIAEQEFSLLAAGLRLRFPTLKIAYGFLEYSSPNIHMALDDLLAQGVNKIYAVPGMLFAATHAQNDIPSVLSTYMAKHPGLNIEYGRELGLHPQMISAFQTRILEALQSPQTPATGSLYDTMLVVVGRGTSVIDANADASKLTRICCEQLGFGWAETVYSGVTFPSVGRGLEMAIKLGYKKIVVAPYFLFGGRLIDRIYAYVDKVALEHPEVQLIKADYLRDQVQVLDTFVERIEETISGPQPALSLMADFQQRLAAGLIDIHHHHAEFQPENREFQPETEGLQPENKEFQPETEEFQPETEHEHRNEHHHDEHSHSHSHSHDHDHSHSHDHQGDNGHGHHHAPYQHIGHPHGPRTMINDNTCCCFMGQFPQSIIDEEQSLRPAAPGIPVCKQS